MGIGDYDNEDLIDEIECRGYIVIDRAEYESVFKQFLDWKG